MEGDEFSVFADVQLPVTQADMSKPTKDFLVNLISVFFNIFHIDGSAIKQVTKEQLSVLTHEDRELYEEVIKLINMHVAMSGVYDRIFFKDFQLIDITNPSPKKTMKLTKFLANFVLYYKNKLSEIEECINGIVERRNNIDQLIYKKKDAMEKIATSNTYRENQLVYKEKMKEKIEEIRKKIAMHSNITEERKEQMRRLESERQKIIQNHASKTSEALKCNEKTVELQAQVVESPEELKLQLQELEKKKDSKMQDSELKYELIKEKKKLLERKEYIQAFILKQAEKLDQVLKIYNEKKVTTNQLENISKEEEEVRNLISKLEKNQEIQQNHCSTSEVVEINQQVEQRLSSLRDQLTWLSMEEKKLDSLLIEEQETQREILLQTDSVREEITFIEKEISDFLKQCQELFKKEILEDMEIIEISKDFCQKKSQNA